MALVLMIGLHYSSDVINAKTIRRIYGGYGPLQMIDFIVNVIMPLVLVFIGWYLVSIQDNYIDAVIMTTALLFISGKAYV